MLIKRGCTKCEPTELEGATEEEQKCYLSSEPASPSLSDILSLFFFIHAALTDERKLLTRTKS